MLIAASPYSEYMVLETQLFWPFAIHISSPRHANSLAEPNFQVSIAES